MAKAGFCRSCGQNVWLREDGGPACGHPASEITNVYEAPEEASPVTTAPDRIPVSVSRAPKPPLLSRLKALPLAAKVAAVAALLALIPLIAYTVSVTSSDGYRAQRLIEKLRTGEPGERTEARDELIEMGRPAVAPLIGVLGDADIEEHVGQALVGIGAPSVKPLIRAIEEGEPKARVSAVLLLGEIGDPDAKPALVKAVRENRDPSVRAAAAGVIGTWVVSRGPWPEGAESLLAAAGDEEPLVRAAAVLELDSFTDPDPMPTLVEALGDPETDVREAALSTLVKHGQQAVRPILQAVVDEGAGAIGSGASSVFNEIGDPAVTVLSSVLKKKQSGRALRVAAANALGDLGSGGVAALIGVLPDGDEAVAEAARDALVEIGDPAVSDLITNASKEKWSGRFRAAATLIRIAHGGDPDARRLADTMEAGNLGRIAKQYVAYIELGQAGTETILVQALLAKGDIPMAEHYLNCGNQELGDGAREWVSRRPNLFITNTGTGGGGPSWGFR